MLKGESGTLIGLQDMHNTDSIMVDNLETVFQIIKVLSQYTDKSCSTQRDKWKFLARWDSLQLAQKLKHYDEFCGHELHIFLYFRDRAFFDSYILRFISSKSKYDRLDYIFLNKEKEVRKMLDFKIFSSLKPIEIAMIILYMREKDPILCKSVISSLESMVGANSSEDSLFRRYFDTVLNHQIADLPLPVTPRSAVPNKRIEHQLHQAIGGGLERAPATMFSRIKESAPMMARDFKPQMLKRQYSNCNNDDAASCCSEDQDEASIS